MRTFLNMVADYFNGRFRVILESIANIDRNADLFLLNGYNLFTYFLCFSVDTC